MLEDNDNLKLTSLKELMNINFYINIMNNIRYHKATTNSIQMLIDSRIEFLSEYGGKHRKFTE